MGTVPGRSPHQPRSDYRSLSLWHETAGDDWVPRDRLPGDLRADVAVVGAGYTGLWTAYYLLRSDPSLKVVVLEKETAGFGASGRNAGRVSAGFAASTADVAALPGADPEAALALEAALRDAVDEIGRVVAREGIDAQFHRGGALALARSRAQLRAARAEDRARAEHPGLDGSTLLSGAEARGRLAATGVRGATHSPAAAVVHPARLVRGLAQVVEASAGGRVFEQTPVTFLEPHRVRTPYGTVTAETVVRATEGYTPTLRGHRRELAAAYSLLIATEPLPERTWREIGLRDGEWFGELGRLAVHGRATRDGRLVFGGRGTTYHYGSQVRAGYDHDPRVFAQIWAALRATLPALTGATVTHAWGGVVALPRDGVASVGLDRRTGLAWAGGYGENGVSTSNLAGRTLCDLVLGRQTDLTGLPWVGHRSRPWPPEPLRWLQVQAGLRVTTLADRADRLRLPIGPPRLPRIGR